MATCAHCKRPLAHGARFCQACGNAQPKLREQRVTPVPFFLGLRPFAWTILFVNAWFFWAVFVDDRPDVLGIIIDIQVWAMIDIILLTVWAVTGGALRDHDRFRARAVRTWAKACPWCDELVRRDAHVCRHCVREF